MKNDLNNIYIYFHFPTILFAKLKKVYFRNLLVQCAVGFCRGTLYFYMALGIQQSSGGWKILFPLILLRVVTAYYRTKSEIELSYLWINIENVIYRKLYFSSSIYNKYVLKFKHIFISAIKSYHDWLLMNRFPKIPTDLVNLNIEFYNSFSSAFKGLLLYMFWSWSCCRCRNQVRWLHVVKSGRCFLG